MSRPRRILLTGFMGAGKTTIGRELACLLDCIFVDLDDLITAREGRTPQALIDEEGEPAFREIETHALAEVLRENSARVVALGGGAWALESNRALVKEHACFTVWLDAPFELCWRRIESEAGKHPQRSRPLARNEWLARKLYDARRASYRLADARIAVGDDEAACKLAGRIAGALEKDEKETEGT
ncbi:MAG: AAA family ATPase [Rubrivivax sp.]|nr:AAA family ATPase [Pyrinomonadaceae bacterium]